MLVTLYIAYFLFQIYETDYHLQETSNAYNDLGIPIAASESDINSRFRKLTVRYHPDKIGPRVDRDKATEFYVHLKQMRDIVLDPAKRFAYDRFGLEALQKCQNCITPKDYIWHALGVTVVSYGALMAILVGANALGFFRDGAYWRYLAILAMATYEVRTALRPDAPPFLSLYLNPLLTGMKLRPAYLPFQLTAVLRKAALALSHCLGLLIPMYRDDPLRPSAAKSGDDSDEARHRQIDRLENAVRHSGILASGLVDMETTPYKGEEGAKRELREAMKKYMMQNTLHSDREVRNAIGQNLKRRREGAPHGARGTM